MSPLVMASFIEPPCFPRVSGDEPHSALVQFVVVMFSPRERG